MSLNLFQNISNEINSIGMLLLIINAIVHILFASAVARDAGQLNKRKTPTVFVSGLTWAFATLVGGVFVAVGYWFVHYSSWARRG